MTLIYLSQDKILGSFIMAMISQKLTQNNHDNLLNLHYNYPLNVSIDIFRNIANDTIIDENILLNKIKILDPIDTIITIFPLIIYQYHHEKLVILDNSNELTQHKNTINIFINIIYLLLTKEPKNNKINLNDLIFLADKNQNIINYFTLINTMIINHQLLTEVEQIFQNNIPVDDLAFSQSLYSFFSNLSNIKSSLKRSIYFSHQSQKTAILTGYLLGLYHGYLNIPYEWRKQIKSSSWMIEINQLTQKLVARWQGKIHNE